MLRVIKATTHQVCSHPLPLTALCPSSSGCIQSFVDRLVRYLTHDHTRRLLIYSQLSQIDSTVLGAIREAALLTLYHIALKHALNAHTAHLVPDRIRSDT